MGGFHRKHLKKSTTKTSCAILTFPTMDSKIGIAGLQGSYVKGHAQSVVLMIPSSLSMQLRIIPSLMSRYLLEMQKRLINFG